jgi:hypothetical protein
MLNESMDELDAGKRDPADLLSAIVAVAKTNVAIVDRFDTAVGDSHAEDVAGQILKDLVTAAGMLGMNDPLFLPDGRGSVLKQTGLVQSGANFCAEDHRQSTDRDKELGIFRIDPRGAIGR